MAKMNIWLCFSFALVCGVQIALGCMCGGESIERKYCNADFCKFYFKLYFVDLVFNFKTLSSLQFILLYLICFYLILHMNPLLYVYVAVSLQCASRSSVEVTKSSIPTLAE